MAEHNTEMIVGNHELMKSLNKKNIFDVIMREGPISRTAISKKVKLALPTVMRVADEFLQEGLILEIGKGDSAGGRKPELLAINPDARYFIGTNISEKIESVVANVLGKIVGSAEATLDYSRSTLNQIRENINNAVLKSGVDKEKIAYSGIGTPGMGFKYYEGVVQHDYHYWSALDVGYYKEPGRFEFPTVVENLSKLGALGELKYGNGLNNPDYLFISAGHGVGMGVVRNGVLDTGANGTSGEFGHTSIDYNGQECYCGNRGCVESYCSTIALLKEYRRERINKGHTFVEDCTLEEMEEAVSRGDECARNAAVRVGKLLGLGLANVINLYNPGAVIVGGDLCTVSLCIKTAFEEAKLNIFMNESRRVKFYVSNPENLVFILGAVVFAREHYFSEYFKK